MGTTRLLLADDHTLMRAGLRALLEGMAGIEVVAEAGTGTEALALLEALRPEVAVLDIAMPGLNGLGVAEQAARQCPGVRVLLLSMHTGGEYLREALRVGVAGYLVKDAAKAELELAVRAVVKGQTYLSPAVAREAVETAPGGQEDPLAGLTPRQQETLRLLAEGRTTREVARVLGISPKTVETHRAHLMERLGIENLPGLVHFAIRAGLVELEG